MYQRNWLHKTQSRCLWLTVQSMCQKQVDMVPVRSRAKMTSLHCKGSPFCLCRGLREQETHAECQGNDVSSTERARERTKSKRQDRVSLLCRALVWSTCFLRCRNVINDALVMLFSSICLLYLEPPDLLFWSTYKWIIWHFWSLSMESEVARNSLTFSFWPPL